MNLDLNELAARAIRSNPDLAPIRAVIVKEIVHYDIFHVLQQSGIVPPAMTFIGGTCLRLCHGSPRLSEDLDFHAGVDFDGRTFNAVRTKIVDYLGDRYGLEVEVREPANLSDDLGFIGPRVHTWRVLVRTSEEPNLPTQRIHIDINNLPTYDAALRPLATNYDFLPPDYQGLSFRASSRQEILADKFIALGCRGYGKDEKSPVRFKARDVWDILWLQSRGNTPDKEMINKKLADHGIENFRNILGEAIVALPVWLEAGYFQQEMSRFLYGTTLAQTANNPKFIEVANVRLSEALRDLQRELAPGFSPDPFFGS